MRSPILLPHTQDIVSDHEGQAHPLALSGCLPMAAWPVSGIPSIQRDYQTGLLRSSDGRRGNPLNPHIQEPGSCGIAGALKGAWIHFQPL